MKTLKKLLTVGLLSAASITCLADVPSLNIILKDNHKYVGEPGGKTPFPNDPLGDVYPSITVIAYVSLVPKQPTGLHAMEDLRPVIKYRNIDEINNEFITTFKGFLWQDSQLYTLAFITPFKKACSVDLSKFKSTPLKVTLTVRNDGSCTAVATPE